MRLRVLLADDHPDMMTAAALAQAARDAGAAAFHREALCGR